MKCDLGGGVCPVGMSRAVVDKTACCQFSKCVVNPSAVADSGLSAMLFGSGFSSIVTGDVIGKHTDAHSKSILNSNGNAQSAVSQDVSVQTENKIKDSTSVLTIVGGNIMGGFSSSSDNLLASDYGVYATGRYNELAKTYAKALGSVSIGAIEGCCPGVLDGSSCPSSCPIDQVCDGKVCVYPRDCPCFTNNIRKPVS